ncbi:predicted Zn finger-like uncharacterized protein [Cereibacter ovatus]|uniref:Predicted Zn finger-like uncharacterized protein n=1 Tax=Cereibacter ovatus TaxID=439529 RepID=A0A285CM41_9RHOB|nr:zinc-ribbon domain-containing protein [Cereibacter ovatus]SNX68620.1 predicted Zn finger-like uncharacterized protein [Cereibacter ovatus]
MRLICPNCNAQYEVSDAAIPPEGRDVQCSNCGHGWFHAPGVVAGPDPLARPPVTPTSWPEAAPPPAASLPEPPAPVDPSFLRDAPLPEDEDDGPDEVPPAAPVVVPPSRSLDGSLLAVLREEALREAEQRRREALGIEAAGDAGPAAPPPVAEPMPADTPAVTPVAEPALADTPVAMPVAEPAPADPPAAMPAAVTQAAGATDPWPELRPRLQPIAEPAVLPEADPDPDPDPHPVGPRPRRALLPDIEEINSTLRPADGHSPAAEMVAGHVPRPSRAAYRAGFMLMIVIALGIATLYVMAPRLAQEMPGAEPALRAFMRMADEARLLLDRLLGAAVEVVRSASDR